MYRFIIKAAKPTLFLRFAQIYDLVQNMDSLDIRPITLSSIHTKMVEALILPDTDLSDTQFGFRENRGTAFACNLLNGCICHLSLFLKLIHVLPVHEWLLLYNWYDKPDVCHLFNIFINQLLLDLNNCDAGVRIGDTLYNSMAYADDITLFSTIET